MEDKPKGTSRQASVCMASLGIGLSPIRNSFTQEDTWMTEVVNKYKVDMDDPDIVYIGRGSIWGNPYKISDTQTRDDVVDAYRRYLWSAIRNGVVTKEMLLELDGKRLACYCAPQACHGDVLVRAIEWAKGG